MPMSAELHYLLYTIILGLLQLLSTGMATTQQHGMKYSMSSRDEQKPLTGKPARVVRAFSNLMQSFPFFAAAVLAAQLLNVHNSATLRGAELYFWARLIYIPLYVFNVTGVRSLMWIVSFAGIAMIMVALL